MKRIHISSFLVFVILLTLACNIPFAVGDEKMTPVQMSSNGGRTSFSGEYSCRAVDSVVLNIDENGAATLSVTGIVYVDYINCTPDPSGFEATYTIVGLADPEVKLITFSSCNEGAYEADGQISYGDNKLFGNVSCTHLTGDDAGQIAIMLIVPPGNAP